MLDGAFGSTIENDEDLVLEDWVAKNVMIILDTGNVPTFGNLNGTSIIDVTMASLLVSDQIIQWRVDV